MEIVLLTRNHLLLGTSSPFDSPPAACFASPPVHSRRSRGIDMAEVLAEGGLGNRPPVRRKFGEQEDILSLKEVVANGAHVVRRGSQCDKYDEVATS
jgi:hypothetical protein